MKSYDFNLEVDVNGFQYAIMEYVNFNVREVLAGDKPTGEYHIKLNDNSSHTSAEKFFSSSLKSCEVGLVDRSGTFNLEYPIYIKTNDEMFKINSDEIFDSLDKTLGG